MRRRSSAQSVPRSSLPHWESSLCRPRCPTSSTTCCEGVEAERLSSDAARRYDLRCMRTHFCRLGWARTNLTIACGVNDWGRVHAQEYTFSPPPLGLLYRS